MSLPESKQDASLASTYEARPGVEDGSPAGVSSASPNTQTLSSSVKNSLNAVAESTPSTESITEQLPSAQGAADAVKTGVSSLLAGVSNLALGANDVVADNAEASHPESTNAEKVDDFHIPGAFDDTTSDTEDIAAVKQSAKSAYNTLPYAEGVKSSLPDAEQIFKQLPSNPLGSLTNQSQRGQTTGQTSDSLGGSSQQGQTHQDGIAHIKNQIGTQQGDSLGGSSQQGQVHQDGIDHIKGQLRNQNTDSVGGSSQQGRIHQDGISYIKDQLHDNHINTVGANSTTAHLAGRVPLEPRGVPQIVANSQRQAGVSPEAAANAEAVQEKKQLERELKGEVPESNTSSTGNASSSAGLDRGVPQVVADSQKKADASPEASANAEAVHEKQEVERELKREVSQQDGAGQTDTSANIGQAVSGGLASAGSALAGAATYARQKTHEATGTDPVAVLPTSAQQAIDGDNTSGTPTRGVTTGATGGQSITDSLAAGASSVGSAATGAATYAREKTHEVTGTDPVAVLPTSAQQAIDGSNTANMSSSGAARGETSGQSYTDSLASGVTNAASYTREKTREVTGTDPVAVLPSSAQQAIDGSSPGNASSHGATRGAAGGQGYADSLASGVSSAGSAATDAASYAREKTREVTGADPVNVLPTSVQQSIDGMNTGSATSHTSYSPSSRLTGGSDAGNSPGGVDLQSGVHNGVVGDHLDDDSKASHRPSSGSHSGHWQPGTSATVAHIPSMKDVDLSAGVKNTVIGSGADNLSGL